MRLASFLTALDPEWQHNLSGWRLIVYHSELLMEKCLGHKDTKLTHMCPNRESPLPATQATPSKINQMATCDHEATSYDVNNHVCIMQKVGKQQTEGHKLAQHQLSN